ncbi:MAG: fused response regulator/phosphatase [Spongiibacteraceae bacterium]|nr:fused response regulator/phosphatase [Spongiibacteraceae bacterium]
MERETHRLLLVDGDPGAHEPIVAYLKKSGYQVEQLLDPDEVLARLEAQPPDVILLDIKNPSYDGLGLLRRIGEHPTTVPVIVIAADGVMDDVVQALRYGASDYLIRPIVDMSVLELAVERCLEQSQLRQENRRYRQQLEEANRVLKERFSILQQDQQAGRHVQRRMLPATPAQFGRYHFSHRVFPSLYLSGDFVDYFTVGDHHVVFFIADVSGHGASSAFVTVLLKNLFARKRSDYGHRRDPSVLSPPAMLDRANRELLATEIGKYITMCVGVLDTRANELRYSVAGHLPWPVLCAGEACQYLKGDSPPVGLYEDAEYGETSLQLPEQFVLALFSDGVLEVLPGEGVLAREQALLNALSPELASIDAVVDALGLGRRTEVPDDIAVLVVSRGEA